VPRIHVSAISLQTPIDELLKSVVADEHSRYPVYQERIDNVVGILHVKDLLPYVLNPEALRSLELQSILHRPVLFVSDNQSAGSVLYEMRQKQQHLAVVIDEFGGVSGVLSLEDLLERIVGDIRDEHDEEEPPIVDLGAGRLMVDASVSMTDLGRYLGTDLPEDDAYTSLGGLLVAQLGRVPQVGTKLREFGLEFVVRDADDRHVARVEILRGAPSSTSLGPVSRRVDSDPT
jgi:CBS domain containing-hemolysin-like protein